MRIWNAIRRFSGMGKRVRADHAVHRAGKRQGQNLRSLINRGLRMEQFEERMLLSISPSSLSELWETNISLARSLENAMDLESYTAEELASATQWVVGLSDSQEPNSLHALAANADYIAENTFLPNAAIWEFDESLDWTTVVDTLEGDTEVEYFYPLVTRYYSNLMVPNDPLFDEQWNLQNTGQNGGTVGADNNVVSAWDTATGAGVIVAIVDDGIQHDHPDLADNYVAALSWDYGENDPDPYPVYDNLMIGDLVLMYGDNHGTCVSGLVGAEGDNDEGISGYAPDADLVGVRIDYSMGWTDVTAGKFLSHQYQSIDVYNNSWGSTGLFDTVSPYTMDGIQKGVTYGRDGLGCIYVFSAGNSREECGQDVNHHGLQSLRQTIAVAALDNTGRYAYYSAPGSGLLISTYADGVYSTDRTGENKGYDLDSDYDAGFNGTSAAAPALSGIVALILEANPNLGYRDVQHILAQTATMNDPGDSDWQTNGAGYHVNHNYGFGAANAAEAVATAKNWQNVGPEKSVSSGVIEVNQAIPDNSENGVIATVTMDDTIDSIEWVELTVDIDHYYATDIEIILTSPDGTVSRVLGASGHNDYQIGLNPLGGRTLTTCFSWGETSEGEWTVEVRDKISGNTGTFNNFELTIYGTIEGDSPIIPIESTGGLELIDVVPNSGEVITEGSRLNVAPRELTLVFNDEQQIDPDTISAVSLKRSGGDEIFLNLNDENVEFGYIAIGDRPNEIVIRFAETLPDDMYQLTLIGEGDSPLTTIDGTVFHDGQDMTITFNLDLGAQVTAIVPQPVTRDADGTLTQSRNTIEVYFNEAMFDEMEANGSVTSTEFYRLSINSDVETIVEVPDVYPESVVYDSQNNKAILTFEQDLAHYGTGQFRLRIGNEAKEIVSGSLDAIFVSDVFATATNITELANDLGGSGDIAFGNDGSVQVVTVSSEIEALPYNIDYPGGIDDVGHRDLPADLNKEEHVGNGDSVDGITTYYYCFNPILGVDNEGNPYANQITDKQKELARQIFELYSTYLGVDFVEDTSFINPESFIVGTGNLKAVNPSLTSEPGGPIGLAAGNLAVMDIYEDWGSNEYNGAWFETAMHEIGHLLGLGHTYDLPGYTVMGSNDLEYYVITHETMYPGMADIIHGQYTLRPDSIDVDVYSFDLDAAGTFCAEIIAERLDNSSLLDSVITVYRYNEAYESYEMIARNDDYYSEDSYVELSLDAGKYYVAVSSTGNTEFDPEVPDSGLGGTSQGKYNLQLTFTPKAAEHLIDTDGAGVSGVTGTEFDGDLDGIPGGVHNFWFEVQTQANTIFVDKLADEYADTQDGSLGAPYSQIDVALDVVGEDQIIRIVGNRAQGFEDQVTKITLTDPTEVVIGDLNNDGIADLVDVAHDNGGDYYAQIRFGIDGTTYKPSTATYLVGQSPSDIKIADLNNDGFADLVVTNSGSNTFSLLINNGDGTFASQVTRFTGDLPVAVEVADLNGDGRLDLVVANQAENTVGVFLGSTASFFSAQVAYAVGATPKEIMIGDVNNDGLLDVVSVNEGGISFLKGNGDGTFAAAVTNSVSATLSAGVLADLDDDGTNDLAVLDADSDELIVMLGNGDGTFSEALSRTVGDYPSAIGVGDSDGDGTLDLFVTNQGSDPENPGNTVSVFFGTGDTDNSSAGYLFGEEKTFVVGSAPAAIAIADVDLNERPDIITANSEDNTLSILTVTRDRAYEIGTDVYDNDLEDGGTLEVPKDVTVMIDAGAVFKLREAIIDVGSSEQDIDRSKGALQVLGTPQASVYFTSFYDNTIGVDNNATTYEAQSGDWGGLVFRNGIDYDMGREVLEEQGIFLNYVNHADLRYGGGKLEGSDVTYTPIHMIESRPTLTFNTITDSANAAISADINSFADTKFGGEDYERIGPEIYGNYIVDNSFNGLFIRIKTSAGKVTETLEISARFDDTDIVHILGENLIIDSTPGGPILVAEGEYGARTDARLCIDPGIILKLSSARIETKLGAQFIAEGTEELPIILTSELDNRYGAGGTFESAPSNASSDPLPGDWSGLYFAAVSNGSIDNAVIAYGGGSSRVEGYWKYFNVIEVHQGNLRLTNSKLEFNDGVTTEEGENRYGREGTEAAVIYVKGAQPILVNNTIINNNAPAISINANSLIDDNVADIGRSTGLLDAFNDYLDNSGPLVRDNRLHNNELNGMVVRGETLSIASVWDDTDIVHILFDEITIPNFHTEGGLRLQSASDESLVVKLYGDNAGFTALGTPTEIDDRIGGTLQVLGAAGYPVVFTSLRDDTVGAGLDPWDDPLLDTDNVDYTPLAGDWRSLKLEEYVNDRNVAVINEQELSSGLTTGTNDSAAKAQHLGYLAPDLKSGDDNLRLGFDIYGFIRANETAEDTTADGDVYAFLGTPGTEVWFDIDSTTLGLDAVIELINANGDVLASSVNSAQEDLNNIARGGAALTMDRDVWNINDVYTTSQNDPGMRVVLPGSGEEQLTYYIRVRGNNSTTHGTYQLQIRLQEEQEIAGSTIQKSQILYATSGIELIGLPTNSPLTIDAVEESGTDGGAKEEENYNDSFANAQYIGNLLASDDGQLQVAGYISSKTDVDWYTFEMNVEGVQNIEEGVPYSPIDWSTVFDVDYASEMAGADLTIYVFSADERLLYVGTDSSVVDDQPDPENYPSADDLARGSFSVYDPFIGPVNLSAGGLGTWSCTYYVAVTSGMTANALSQDQVRIGSIDSVTDIFGDKNLESTGLGNNDTVELLEAEANLISAWISDYTLDDVVLYMTDGKDLYTVNPYTGEILTDVTGGGRLPDVSALRDYRDLAMTPGGELYSILCGMHAGNEGQYQQFSTGDGSLLSTNDDGITVYWLDDEEVKADAKDGISFEAMAYIPNDLLSAFGVEAGGYIAIGNYNGGKYNGDFTTDLVYIFDSEGNAVQHFSVDDALEEVLISNIAPWGQVLINGEGSDDTIRLSAASSIYDGDTLTLQYDLYSVIEEGGSGEVELLGTESATFEFDLGLTAKVVDNVKDGETFRVGISGDLGSVKTFEFDTDGSVASGNIAVTVAVGASPSEIIEAVKTAATDEGLNVTTSGSRIAFADMTIGDFSDVSNMDQERYSSDDLDDSNNTIIELTLEDSASAVATKLLDAIQAIEQPPEPPEGSEDPAIQHFLPNAERIGSLIDLRAAGAVIYETSDYLYIKPGKGSELYDDQTLTVEYQQWTVPEEDSGDVPEMQGTGNVTFEYDLGLIAKVADGVNDGQTFTVGIATDPTDPESLTESYTFEFDSGPYLAVTDVSAIVDDEAQFSLKDKDGNWITFAFDTNGAKPGSFEYIGVTADMTEADLAELIAETINNTFVDEEETIEFGVKATASGNLVTLLNDDGYTTSAELDGVFFVLEGTTTPGSIAVEIDGDTSPEEIAKAIRAAAAGEGISVSSSGDRVAFADMNYYDFSGVASMNHEGDSMPGLADPASGNVLVKVALDDDEESVASRLVLALNRAPQPPSDDPDGPEFQHFLTAFNDYGTVCVSGAAMGKITGLSFVNSGDGKGSVLYASDSIGNIFIIEGANTEGFDVPTKSEVEGYPDDGRVEIEDIPESGPRAILVNNYIGYEFSGLTIGPQNAENQIYADLLFASGTGTDPITGDTTQLLLSVDTDGFQVPIFTTGYSTLAVPGLLDSTGLAFSTLDYTLWSGDGTTMTFSSSSETYDFPGGAHGTLITEPFSLTGYSSDDLPVLTFNYNLETDGDFGAEDDDPYTSDYSGPVTDTVRVYITPDQGEHWFLLASNTNRTTADAGAVLLVDGSGVEQQCIVDLSGIVDIKIDMDGDGEPERIDLSQLQLKFDFSTDGTLGVGDLNGDGVLEKCYLRTVSGCEIEDRSILTVKGIDLAETEVTFEYQIGYSIVLPNSAGQAIQDEVEEEGELKDDGEFILIRTGDDESDEYVAFEFVKDGECKTVDEYADMGKTVSEVVPIYLDDSYATFPVAKNVADIINEYYGSDYFAYVVEDQIYLTYATDVVVGSVNMDTGIMGGSSITILGSAPDADPAPTDLRIYPWTADWEIALITAEAINKAFIVEGYRDEEFYEGFLATVKQESNKITFAGGYAVMEKGPHYYVDQPQPGEESLAIGQTQTEMNEDTSWSITGASYSGVQHYYNLGAQDNNHSGVSIRNIHLGFVERGTSVAFATPDSTFSLGSVPDTYVGQYQLTIRSGSEYDAGGMYRMFNTNDRNTEGITLLMPDAGDIASGDSFTVSDGLNTQTFQFVDEIANNVETIDGAIQITYSQGMSGEEIAKLVCDAINDSDSTIITATVIFDDTNVWENGSYRVDLFNAEQVVGIEHIVFDADGTFFLEGLAITSVYLQENIADNGEDDIVMFDEATQTIQVFRFYESDEIGSGYYRQQTLAIGTEVSDLSLRDINGDGLLDLIAVCPVAHAVATALNSGAGYFSQIEWLVGEGLMIPDDAQVGFYNDDEYLDVVYLSESEDKFYAGLGNENGFDPAISIAVGDVPRFLLGADLNGDNYKDFVVANAGSNTLSVLLNDGTGHFQLTQTVDTDSMPLTLGYYPGIEFDDEIQNFIVSFNADDSASLFICDGGGYLSPEPVTLEDLGIEVKEEVVGETLAFQYTDEINVNSTAMNGDANDEPEQGYILVEANEILYASQYGIYSDAGIADPWTHPGAVAPLVEENYEQFVPGISIQNNLIVDAGAAGVYFSGTPDADEKTAAVPFGRILNNTIYGCDMGIMVSENASPTILNNIVSNNRIGIVIDGTSQTSVVGCMIYHENGNNHVGLPTLDENSLFLDSSDPLFVSAENNNFYLAEYSPAIDNAMDSLQDRYHLSQVFNEIGYASSPILAPDYDLYGQLRSDDPYMDADPGSGLDPFTDRGAIDRVDIARPTAVLIDPFDFVSENDDDQDPLDLDRDNDVNEVFIAYERTSTFAIKLSDSTTGAGIADYTVVSDAVKIYKNGSDVAMFAGVDYYFSYDSQENVIRLYPVNGTWDTGSTYEIVLDNSADGITDIAGNPLATSINRNDGLTAFNISIASFDFGDAPDDVSDENDYLTYLGDTQDPDEGGARHIQIGDYYLGSYVTGEDDTNIKYDADTGEMITDAKGDAGDDGVTFADSALLIGNTTQVIVTASRNGGYLNAWIDFNGDGDWDDTIGGISEHVLSGELLNEGENTFDITVPAGLESTISYARFRYSSEQNLDTFGEAPDGEVEDYQVHIVNALLDYGDAPESYGTTLEDDGARHEVHNDVILRLGSEVDNEIDGLPHPDAVGDDQIGEIDNNAVVNDEDGVDFSGQYFIPGQTTEITVTTTGDGKLNAWIDFNGDGVWDESEQIATNEQVSGIDTVTTLTVNVPVDAVSGQTFARFRLSSQENLGPTGQAPDGEVEDYAIVITSQPRDFGDAPRSYLTQENSSAPWVLLSLPGKDNDILVTANTLGTKYDDVKFVIVNEITYGDDARVTYNTVTGSYIIDIDPNATTAQAVIEAINDEGTFSAIVDVTDDINNDGTGLIGTTTGLIGTTSGGYDGVGENAVSHDLGTGLMLGTQIDAEMDGVATDDAQADDQAGVDDEDGFGAADLTDIQFIAGEQNSLSVTVTLGEGMDIAYLNGWIDFNQDGVFDETEQVITAMEVTENWVDESVTIILPIDVLEGETYARFRISTQEDLDWFGPALDGEVEDYKVSVIKGDAMIQGHAFQDLNFNTVWDAGEPCRAGVLVYIDMDGDGTPNYDNYGVPTEPYTYTMEDDQATVDVDETGYYEFSGLFGQPTPYTVREVTPDETLRSYPNELVTLPDTSHGNSDGSYTIFLDDGETVSDVNFGYYEKAHIRVDDVVVVEGDMGYTDVTVTVTVTQSFGADLLLNYMTRDGDAMTGDSDYISKSGNFTFYAQETPTPTWSTTVLTTTKTNDYDYGADGQFVIWEGSDGNDWEIYLFAGEFDDEGKPVIHQLTDNATDDRDAKVCAVSNADGTTTALVTWTGYANDDGTDTEIFLYQGDFNADGTIVDNTASVIQVTDEDNVFEDNAPQVSERFVTWWANDGQSNEIFYYDLQTGEVNPLTENGYSDKDPIVQGSNIVWVGDKGNGSEIFLFTGEYDEHDNPVINQITDNYSDDKNPAIDGDYIVWEGYEGVYAQIFLYQISTGTTTQLTSDSSSNQYPQISGQDIVWQTYDGSDWEIYHYNIEAATDPVNISSDSDYSDERPEILDGKVVWYSSNTTSKITRYYELRGDDPIVTISDTTESAWYPHLTDTMAVWRSYNGTNYDVVIATQNEPEATQTLTFRVVGDGDAEEDEAFYIDFGAVNSGWVYFDDSEAKVTILNDDGQIDFGDAPASYSTLLVDNGARHRLSDTFQAQLGQIVDRTENDGLASSNSMGDDNMGQDDEDGVTFTTALVQDSTAIISVEVSLPDGADPSEYYLDAWIDFDGNGNWDGLDEKIFDGELLELGTNTLDFEVPVDAVAGLTHARFRLSSMGGLDYIGQVTGGEVEDYQIEILAKPNVEDRSINLTGTSGNDTFIFTAGSMLTVNLNGADYTYNPADVDEILFDGGAGNDTVIFNGSYTNETVDIWTNHAKFTASNYYVSTTNVESITAVAGSESDTVTMYGSSGNDLLVSLPDSGYATLTGTGFFEKAEGFSELNVYGNGGNDQAKLYGSTGNDTYSASPTSGQMVASGMITNAYNFRYLSGYAIDGGYDSANLSDLGQDQDDVLTFTVSPNDLTSLQNQDAHVPTIRSMATMVNNGGLNLSAYNFEYVSADSTGGMDEANLYGSPAVDTFKGKPVGFDSDTGASSGSYAKLYGTYNDFSYTCMINEFRYVSAAAKESDSSEEQEDVAFLIDSPGSDTFTGAPTYSKMVGEGFYYRADNFNTVKASSDNGGEDVAVLYDSSGDDVFKGAHDLTKLYAVDESYSITASDFKHLNAYAKYGGYDTAELFGSERDDTYLTTPDYAKMTRTEDDDSQSFYRAYYFKQVTADGVSGYDTAKFVDSEYADKLMAGWELDDEDNPTGDTYASLSNDNYANFNYIVKHFAEVTAKSTSSGDKKDVDNDAIDFILTTEGVWDDLND